MITLILLILAAAFYVVLIGYTAHIAAIIFLVIASLYLLVSISHYINSKKMIPSKMQCPNCGSGNVKIERVMTGSKSSSTGAAFGGGRVNIFGGLGGGGIGSSFGSTNFGYKREAVCAECGFNYDYITNEDIENVKNKYIRKMVIAAILLVVSIFCLSKTSDFINGSNDDNETKSETKIEETEPIGGNVAVSLMIDPTN